MKPHKWITDRKQRLLIEDYALLTESAPDLRGRLDQWDAFYKPATPGESELLDIAVMASTQHRRVLSHITEVVNHQIRTAFVDFDRAQEDEVERYRAMLPTSPGAAVLGLKRSALGLRLLISRFERLESLLVRDGTLYGSDRNELINYQGACAIPTESLFESEAAYLTYLYCLLAQPAPQDKHVRAMGNEALIPEALNDRDAMDWLAEKHNCQQFLKELVAGELASLRKNEEILRFNYEDPARDGAELRNQVLAGPDGALLLRHARTHDLAYHRAYEGFLKGRAWSFKTGLLPGAPLPDLHGVSEGPTPAEPDPKSTPAEQKAQRKRTAAALAPGAANGIGAPAAKGDAMVKEAMRETAIQEKNAVGRTPAASPIERDRSSAT